MSVKTDKPLLAVLIGIFIIFPVELYSQILKYFNLTHVSSFEFISMLMTSQSNWWLGLLIAPGVAGLAVLAIYYSAKIWGTDYFIFKGILIGMVTYAFIDISVSAITGSQGSNLTVTGHYAHASAGAFGGLLSNFLVKNYLYKSTSSSLSKKKLRRFAFVPQPSQKPKQKEKKIRLVKPKRL